VVLGRGKICVVNGRGSAWRSPQELSGRSLTSHAVAPVLSSISCEQLRTRTQEQYPKHNGL